MFTETTKKKYTTNLNKIIHYYLDFNLLKYYKVSSLRQNSQEKQESGKTEQHLAIYAAANNNICIRRAELKGKNVIWALQQQLQTTQKRGNIIFQSRFSLLLDSLSEYLCFLASLW